jgi:hypothetical protein
MKKFLKVLAFTVIIFSIIWTFLTIWVEGKGPAKSWELGSKSSLKTALIIYDPDPFYNLDEQISRKFGQALADHGMHVHVASVAAAGKLNAQTTYDLYVLCANTYNWRPDWALTNFIENEMKLKDKSVVAITLGSGSTEESQQVLEEIIRQKNGHLIGSRSLWLMRPNDESRMEESNVAVSLSMAYTWGEEMANKLYAAE